MVKMKSKALSPHLVPTVGEVQPGEIFEVTEDRAKELEKGLYERITTKATAKPKTKGKKEDE